MFYNLGNAQYRAGDLGRAILNYERALALEPQHPEAEANLRLVRDKARALELQSNWWDRLTARASSEALHDRGRGGVLDRRICVRRLVPRAAAFRQARRRIRSSR